MTTPWEQAEAFAKKCLKLKVTTPTRPIEVLNSIVTGTCKQLDLQIPQWVFLVSGGRLFEWKSNLAESDIGRECLGLAKIGTIKNDGGMIFSAFWLEGRLVVPCVYIIDAKGIHVFQDGKLVSESEWDMLADYNSEVVS